MQSNKQDNSEQHIMTITLDRVTAEMLKELMKKARTTDAKKFLTQQIRNLYQDL